MRRVDATRAGTAISVALLAGAFACGGKAERGAIDSDTPALPVPPQVPAELPRSRDGIPYDPALAIENVLDADCGLCHGPRAPGAGSGGINFINDVDRLVEAGLIIPLNSAASRIVIVMRDGSMPPAGSGFPLTPSSDLESVIRYIDNPRFWGDADGG